MSLFDYKVLVLALGAVIVVVVVASATLLSWVLTMVAGIGGAVEPSSPASAIVALTSGHGLVVAIIVVVLLYCAYVCLSSDDDTAPWTPAFLRYPEVCTWPRCT